MTYAFRLWIKSVEQNYQIARHQSFQCFVRHCRIKKIAENKLGCKDWSKICCSLPSKHLLDNKTSGIRRAVVEIFWWPRSCSKQLRAQQKCSSVSRWIKAIIRSFLAEMFFSQTVSVKSCLVVRKMPVACHQLILVSLRDWNLPSS